MPLTVKHAKVSGIADSGNAALVEPSDWNATHVLTGSIGDTFYISPTGSDSNNGLTQATPWQTITKVNAQTPTPGTTYLFQAGGTFTGGLTLSAGGSAALPITYGSYGDLGNNATPPATQAIISSGNSAGFIATDPGAGFITIQNLTFLGGGISTNATWGIKFSGLNNPCSGITVSNCTISQYGLDGIQFIVGNQNNPSVDGPIWDTILINNCVIHDCGETGVLFITQNARLTTTPQAIAFRNVTVQNSTMYNITGQNVDPIFIPGGFAFTGAGISINGGDGLLFQNNLIHDNAQLSTTNMSVSTQPLSGIYTADCANSIIQSNEIYNQLGASGVDCTGITLDQGEHNVLVQYNYIHDCHATAIISISGGFANLTTSGVTIRYNICANCGLITGGESIGGGIAIAILHAGDIYNNVYIYNNTIYETIPNNAGALQFGGAVNGNLFNLVLANNLSIAGSAACLKSIQGSLSAPFFLNNGWAGGNPNNRTTTNTTPSGTVSDSGGLDGAPAPNLNNLVNPQIVGNYLVNTTAMQGLLTGFEPFNTASLFQLQPSSPYIGAGLNLQTICPLQLISLGFLGTDFSFTAQQYSGGGGITDITCSRTASTATDLLPTDPQGRAFNTFAANTLRITTGRGLLIEEARTQYLVNPGAPATQTTASLSAGNYVLWVNGPGSAQITAGTAVIGGFLTTGSTAAQNQFVTVVVTSPGTLVITVSGTLNQFQLENSPAGDNAAFPTSFISAAGTRDADVVTSATSTGFGTAAIFAIGTNGPGTAGGIISYNSPNGVPGNNSTAVLLTDNSNASYVGFNNTNVAGSLGPFEGVFKNSAVTVTTANSGQPNVRQVISWRNSTVDGETVCMNGGSTVNNPSVQTPTLTTPVHIGNNAAATQPFNGYIQRIIFDSSINNGQMQQYSSIVPIASGITRDFFGNPVPGASGTISIGAHQPQFPSNIAMLNVPDQLVTGGANVTDLGLATGNVTIDCGARPLQSITNGGAFSITAPASDGSCMVLITNNSLAGAVTFSGFSVGSNTGDALTTTNTNKFTVSIWRVNSISGYRIAAHQ